MVFIIKIKSQIILIYKLKKLRQKDESVPSEFSGTEIEDFIKEQETDIQTKKAETERRGQEELNKDNVLSELKKIVSKETFENANTEGQIEQRVIFVKEHSNNEKAKELAKQWLNIKNHSDKINARYDAKIKALEEQTAQPIVTGKQIGRAHV